MGTKRIGDEKDGDEKDGDEMWGTKSGGRKEVDPPQPTSHEPCNATVMLHE